MEVAGELRQRQVGGNVWWAPHRDGSPGDAGGLAAREWLGACAGASRYYDARDSRQPMSPTQGELAISLRQHCTSCNTVPVTATAEDAVDLPEFEDRCHQREDIPRFQYWATLLELEVLVLVYMRSLRQALMYLDAVMELAP